MTTGKKIVLIILILLGVLLVIGVGYLRLMQLDDFEKMIAKQHPVPAISVTDFYQRIHSADSAEVVVFDTREAEEFRRSHLPGAIQVDPEMDTGVFLAKYRDAIAGKKAVFYCSVGYRSSVFAERLLKTDAVPATAILNLRGGIFRWYNSGLPVYNERGETGDIHPYNKFWAHLVKSRR